MSNIYRLVTSSGTSSFSGEFDSATKMKLVHREISDKSKDTSGSVTLVPEEMEDMWHIYNLIAVGDYVRASTIR